jgi:hypothetical protein
MPAWGYARRAARENRSAAQAQNASHQRTDGDESMRRWARMLWKRYKFEDEKCFFCGGRRHHTGHLPGLGAIWLCKDKRCAKYYGEAREVLG